MVGMDVNILLFCGFASIKYDVRVIKCVRPEVDIVIKALMSNQSRCHNAHTYTVCSHVSLRTHSSEC